MEEKFSQKDVKKAVDPSLSNNQIISKPAHWVEIKLIQVETKKPLKFLINVPKRIVHLSTKRSRIKRLIRETMRFIEAKPNSCYYIRVKKDFPDTTKQQDVSLWIKEALKLLNKE